MYLSKKQGIQKTRILDKIYTKGPISRIEISKELNITPATVSEITNKLIDEKHIHELGEDETGNKPGRKKILLTISSQHSYFIGVELSDKFLSFCLSDNLGSVIEQQILYHNSWDFQESFTETFFLEKMTQFIEQYTEYDPVAVGIAIPGHYDSISQSIKTNHPFWQTFPLKDIIASIDLPVYFKNNVKCMAIAERLFGEYKQDKNFIFLHVRRGMFCTYMYNGEIYAENNHLIGEIGHTVINPNGALCECGKRGCLQTYTSESWMIKKANLLYEDAPHTFLKQLVAERKQIDIDTLIKAYQLGDEGSITIINQAIHYFSIAINNLLMIMDSDIVYIHSELFSEPELADLLVKCIDENASLLNLQHPKQRIFKRYDEINGALGACGLCIYETL
ncbi:ROK family transcriptional regulator [Carnobacterium sp. CS13]|uniref:ROK family transcriptional regulator n=1 Tax=Carnobacterium sp. CS13 TaxID=2800128 RepID=UPI001F2A62E7|nr:ROK family transcriptional regulator [Carnobacterium sp. CS13]